MVCGRPGRTARCSIPEEPDVLEHGGGDRPPRRWLPIALAVVALLALVGYGVVRLANRGPSSTPDAVPSRSAAAPTPTDQRVWPVTTGACGSQAYRPLTEAGPVTARTGLRVLVGGAQLAEVDLDSARTRIGSRVPHADRSQAQTLVRHGTDVYALVTPCDGKPGRSQLLRVGADGRVRQVPLSGPVDGLIGGPAGVFGVDYPPDDATPGPASPVRLRPVGGGTVEVSGDLLPLGVTSAGIVALANGEHADGEPPQLVLLDASTGRVTGTVAGGYPLGVEGDSVVWYGKACQYIESGPAGRCVLHVADVGGGPDRSYRLPAGRMPMSNGVGSADGRFVALQLSDSRDDTRYAFDHPGPPSAVAVLDLVSHRVQVMPGLELPPKTGAGLAFSPDDQWLAVTMSEGDHGHLLLWRIGSDRLQRSDARLAGPLDGAPPLVFLP